MNLALQYYKRLSCARGCFSANNQEVTHTHIPHTAEQAIFIPLTRLLSFDFRFVLERCFECFSTKNCVPGHHPSLDQIIIVHLTFMPAYTNLSGKSRLAGRALLTQYRRIIDALSTQYRRNIDAISTDALPPRRIIDALSTQ